MHYFSICKKYESNIKKRDYFKINSNIKGDYY